MWKCLSSSWLQETSKPRVWRRSLSLEMVWSIFSATDSVQTIELYTIHFTCNSCHCRCLGTERTKFGFCSLVQHTGTNIPKKYYRIQICSFDSKYLNYKLHRGYRFFLQFSHSKLKVKGHSILTILKGIIILNYCSIVQTLYPHGFVWSAGCTRPVTSGC